LVCGVGLTDGFPTSSLGALYGVDLSYGVIEKAAQAHPSAHYRVYDGKILPFPDNTVDLMFAICAMHHVSPASWEDFVREMKRVAKNGGLVAVFGISHSIR
jgi:ubiquinone/menaquinone biosynthesis C-methylase UbiE